MVFTAGRVRDVRRIMPPRCDDRIAVIADSGTSTRRLNSELVGLRPRSAKRQVITCPPPECRTCGIPWCSLGFPATDCPRRAYDAKAPSIRAIRVGSRGRASAAATHSRSSARFLQPITTVSTSCIDSA